MQNRFALTVALLIGSYSAGYAQDAKVDMHEISSSGVGGPIGTIGLADTPKGLQMSVNVSKLKPGEHGFHVHEKGDCGPGTKDGKPAAGIAAGSHYDPDGTATHLGPDGKGHLGDLPKLVVTDGSTKTTLPSR